MAKRSPIINEIFQRAQQAGNVDPYTLAATALVESGGNTRAVGDNGSSFGLFQLHRGGALGSHTADWAFNPQNSIQDALSRFRGGSGGQFAASVQRPADRAGYARKVDAQIQALKRGGGFAGALNAPVAGGANYTPSVNNGDQNTAAKQMLISMVFGDRPNIANALTSSLNKQAALTSNLNKQAVPPLGGTASSGPSFTPPKIGEWKGGNDYRALDKIAMGQFGLRHDPGNTQTTGGHHSQGSEHYAGRAVDFGTGRNSVAALEAWANWARAHGLDVLREDWGTPNAHYHVSTHGGKI